MDKEIWLRVIREELGILEELATGMINDGKLTMEEVELSIARSKIVTREFEMLFSQIKENSQKEVGIPTKEALMASNLDKGGVLNTPSRRESVTSPVTPERNEPVMPSAQPEKRELLSLIDAPTAQIPVAPTHPGTSTHSPIEFEFPIPVVAAYTLSPNSEVAPANEGHAVIDSEVKKEEHPLFKLTPIRSLKDGLTLNDRYLYQRELFNNDKARLDGTIEEMDRLNNIQEAVAYLKENFKWTKGEASEKFVLLVKRRFSEPKG